MEDTAGRILLSAISMESQYWPLLALQGQYSLLLARRANYVCYWHCMDNTAAIDTPEPIVVTDTAGKVDEFPTSTLRP